MRVGRATVAKLRLAHPLILLRRRGLLAGALGLSVGLSLLALGRFGSTARAWALVPLIVGLGLIVVLDLRFKLVPDVLTYPGTAYALCRSVALNSPPILDAIIGAAVGGGLVLLLAVLSRGGIGGGDIKLMVMLGAALGWKEALAVFGLSQIAGLLILVGVSIARRRMSREPLPIGSLIALLGALSLVLR